MKKLKIKTHSMLSPINTRGGASSWVYTIHSIMREFEKMNHDLYFITTDGVNGVDKKWYKYFRDCPEPDISINYTLPSNWPHRFNDGVLAGTKRAKLRLAIFNYESSILPKNWSEHHTYVDHVLASSEYCRDIFIRAGIPQEKVLVLPLGISHDELLAPLDNYELKTKKRFKILNISIPHHRKNIPLLIDAYFDEFSAKDDVCLVLKTSLEKKETFEIDVMAELKALQAKYNKDLPEIEIITHRFNNIATLYKKTDALINVASSEGFGLDPLGAMFCNKLVATPRYGGVLEYMEHNKNGLLIDTVEGAAGPQHQYWMESPGAVVGYPVKSSIMTTMRNMYENQGVLLEKFGSNMKDTANRFTWKRAAETIIDLYNGKVPVKVLGEML
jgi:glycosyltransferase involved in cell wall biosynthesis